jgi:arginine utilization protein RocB
MSDEIMKLVAQRKQLDETFRRKEKDLELHRLNWRDACKKIELKLVEICEHDYTRENYAYAPLYCRHCLLEKEQVWRLKAHSQN